MSVVELSSLWTKHKLEFKMKSLLITEITDGVIKLVTVSGESQELKVADYAAELGFEVGGVIILADDNTVSKVLTKAEVEALPGIFTQQTETKKTKPKKEKETTRGSSKGSYHNKHEKLNISI